LFSPSLCWPKSANMISLSKRLRADSSSDASQNQQPQPAATANNGRASIRDRLLVKEVQEMEQTLPGGCRVRFDDPNALHDFVLTVSPDDGPWQGGKFRFRVSVPPDYNLSPPAVRCLTKLWHPNIDGESGDVCLSILRVGAGQQDSGLGWTPTRRLRDVIWGLSSLFGDLLNFEDPLNAEAAEHHARDKEGFRIKVRDWVQKYAKK